VAQVATRFTAVEQVSQERRGEVTARRALLAAALWAALPAAAFDLQGHRGARGLAPENTMAAFERALALGVTTLETDLAVTRDGVVVISHDPYLNPDIVRGPDGAWLAAKGPTIRSITFEELQRYDIGRTNPASSYAKGFPDQTPSDGQRFPRLTDVFALGAPKGVRFNVETKITPTSGGDTPDPETFAKLVVAAIRDAGLSSRVTVQSFDWRTLVAVKKLAPEIATVCLTIETPNNDTVQRSAAGPSPWHAGLALSDHGGSLPRLVKAAGCGTWSMFWRNLTPEGVAEAHGVGLLAVPWTVNDPADMKRLVDWGVDGIITDYPDRWGQTPLK
jgi:glycerophosphoryl diester phosphodiesterase